MRQTWFVVAWCISVLVTATNIQIPRVDSTVLGRRRLLEDTSHDLIKQPSNTLPISTPRRLFRRGPGNSRSSSVVRPHEANPNSPSTSRAPTAGRERSRSPRRSDASSRSNSPTHSSSSSGRRINSSQSQSSGRTYGSARSRSLISHPFSGRSSSSGTTSSSGWSLGLSSSRSSGSTTSGTSGTTTDSGPSHYSRDSNGQPHWPHNVIPPTKALIRTHGPSVIGSQTTSEVGNPQWNRFGPATALAESPFKSKVFGATFGGSSRAVAMGDVAKARVRTGDDSFGYLKTLGPDGVRIIHVNPNSHGKVRVESDMPGLNQVMAISGLTGEGALRAKSRNI